MNCVFFSLKVFASELDFERKIMVNGLWLFSNSYDKSTNPLLISFGIILEKLFNQNNFFEDIKACIIIRMDKIKCKFV